MAADVVADAEAVYVHVAAHGRLAAPAGRYLPPDATRAQLHDFMLGGAPATGNSDEDLVPLSAATAANFAAALRKWENALVMDGAAWDAVLTPTLAGRSRLLLAAAQAQAQASVTDRCLAALALWFGTTK